MFRKMKSRLYMWTIVLAGINAVLQIIMAHSVTGYMGWLVVMILANLLIIE